jgi:hypothetical protein
MPRTKIIAKAHQDAREGKSPSTQAGEFVREEMHHIREGKHGARSTKQAIAIGLSEARRAGVNLPARGQKKQDASKKRPQNRPSAKRSQAVLKVLKNEPTTAASPRSLSRQAHESAAKRGPQKRRQSAMKAVSTKGRETMKASAQKGARTRKKAA